ncbi:hypothetical protein DRN32_07545 [Thermococci archaeon]|nr:MAG: hypothetical protein DRN32_07545 [Thermococci archaeon]
MISYLKIENFRGIRSLELENLGQVNVIAGKNNSCKSSVLEALALALSAVNRNPTPLKSTLNHVLTWRGWFGKSSISALFYRHELPIRLQFVTSDRTPFLIEIRYSGNLIDTMIKELRVDHETLKRVFSGELEVLSLKSKAGPLLNEATAIVARDGTVTVFSSQKDLYPVEMLVRFVTPYDIVRPGYIEEAFSWAFKLRAYSNALALIRQAYPEVVGLSTLPENGSNVMYVDIKYSKNSIPYYVMGDGFKILLMTASLVAAMRNGYLLIDSAEAFHHPKSLRIMAQTLIKGAKENNVQVFLTTHSLELIDMLLEYGLEEGVDGRIVYMKRENGKLTHSIETFENAKELREDLGIDLRG